MTGAGRMLWIGVVIWAAAVATEPMHARPAVAAPCRRCGWVPPATKKTMTVHTVGDLELAVQTASANTTILIADGTYRLDRTLDVAVPRVVLRSESGDPARVVLRGESMVERRVGVALSISAPDVVVADLSIGDVGYHAVQIRGESGASRAVLHNLRLSDTGEQIIKGSISDNGRTADDDLVACSVLGYTDAAPSDYTDGIDVIAGRRWTVRDNRFERIRGPRDRRYSAGPAIVFWGHSQGTVIERNLVLDSFRGIALGLVPTLDAHKGATAPIPDHDAGVVRGNVVWNLNHWADEGIELNGAARSRIERNTVLVEGSLGWSISVRFPLSDAVVVDNLTNRRIVTRDQGRATASGNIDDAESSWFADSARGDLRVVAGRVPSGVGAAPPAGAWP